MYVKLTNNFLRCIVCLAIKKAGSERQLCKALGFSKGALHKYKNELSVIPLIKLKRLCNFLKGDFRLYKGKITRTYPDNWRQVKGGKACSLKYEHEGILSEITLNLNKNSSIWMKNWHKKMKLEKPEFYYKLQYDRFKKVGRGYRYCLDDMTYVRNNLEREVGNYLLLRNIKFEYEPYVNINGKAYFPDFRIGKMVIEVTAWKHPNKEKLAKLKKKIKDYKASGYHIVFFVPPEVRKFYKELQCPVISALAKINKLPS